MKKIPLITIVLLISSVLLAGCNISQDNKFKPKVGAKAIVLPNQVVSATVKGEDLCTLSPRACSMHTISMAESLKAHRPILLQFASPIHCTICDTQLAMDMELTKRYGKEMDFIHLDGYKEPKVVGLWGHKGDPWTFLIDRNGEIAFVLAGSSEYSELESDIKKTLAIPEKKHD